MDCTDSMGEWIKQCKDNLKNIVDAVKSKSKPKAKIRVGYIGYRDYYGDKKDFDIFPFSDNIE